MNIVDGLDEKTKAPELSVLNDFHVDGTPVWIQNILKNNKEETQAIPAIHKFLDTLIEKMKQCIITNGWMCKTKFKNPS